MPPQLPRNLPDTKATVTRLAEKYRSLLSAPIVPDDFLSGVARATPSHRFLGNSVQAVYVRQVAFLSAILQDYQNVPAQQIKVLDWGCGKGHITYLLRSRGFDVTSSDVVNEVDDTTMLGQDAPILRTSLIPVVPLRHPSDLPFKDGEFDCVLSFGVLEHVESDIASLHEIRRILKPGGLLFVTFLPYFLSWTQALARLRGIGYHDRLYNKGRLLQLADNAGFQLASAFYGQLLPKNSVPISFDKALEPLDRFMCDHTPLKHLATNLEVLLVAA
jgi:SAM-dependent methyltransferase